jgi:hypothetical protein
MKKLAFVLLLVGWNTVQSFSAVDTLRHCGYLTVHSERVHVFVYSDTAFIGSAPLLRIPMEPGIRVLRFTRSDGKQWYSSAITETVIVREGEEIMRHITFPVVRHVTSVPDGALVTVGDSVVGSTPLFLESSSPGEMITLSREGYESILLPMNDNVHVVLIRNESGSSLTVSPYLVSEEGKNQTSLYITAGTTVLTGAAAAYFKIKADSYYNDYRRSGSSSDLDNVRRFDLLSGISLAASEISFLILTYHLLSQ